MATPHYVVKKVGDKYVTVPKQLAGRGDPLFLLAGLWMLLRGVRRRGFLGAVAAVLGGCLAYRGLTGRTPAPSGTALRQRPPRTPGGPSHQHDVRPVGQKPKDAVDEASMESFPASDPPARMTPAKSV